MSQPTYIDACDLTGSRCDTCGSCPGHAGCAYSGGWAEGDCPECGACADCTARCQELTEAAAEVTS